MTGSDDVAVARDQVDLETVVHAHVQLARDDVRDVVALARVGADERLDVVRPPPARAEDRSADRRAGQLDQMDVSVFEAVLLIGRVEVLGFADHESS
jgi:hypothetical protein